MRHIYIKRVIAKTGKTMFYLGDGLWFGRISQDKAELGLATGKYKLWGDHA